MAAFRPLPCFCMTLRNLIITLEEGLIITCRLPRFSALYMFLRASLSTLILTILLSAKFKQQGLASTDSSRDRWSSPASVCATSFSAIQQSVLDRFRTRYAKLRPKFKEVQAQRAQAEIRPFPAAQSSIGALERHATAYLSFSGRRDPWARWR